MATRIAIEPTKITNMSFRRYDRNQNIPFEDLFLQKPNGELIYLKDLQSGDTADTMIKTIDDFFKNYNKLQYKGTKIVDMGLSMEDVFYRATTHTDISSSHTSTAGLPLTNGASRTYSLVHKSELAPGERRYGNDVVFVGRLRGYAQDTIMEASDIYYIHPVTKARINLFELENVLRPSFKNFTHAVYMYEDKDGVSREIEAIDLRNAYTCQLTTYEAKKENGLIETHTFDDKGNDIIVDSRFTNPNFVEKKTIADDDKGTTLIQNKLFKRSANGEFVGVRVKGQEHLIKVNISDLYDKYGNPIVAQDSELSAEEFDTIKGLELQVKLEDGKMLDIEPLTIDNERYTTERVLALSHSAEDVMADNAYLKLQNGEMFRESAENLQPKSYNIIADTAVADAYLVRLSNGQFKIIDKAYFEKQKLGNNVSFNFAGAVVRISSVHKLGRTTAANAELYQTSNVFGSKVHACRVVKKVSELGLIESFDAEQEMAEGREDFLSSYRAGNYILDKVEILDKDGNVKLQDVVTNKEEKGERYIYTDTFETEDDSQKTGYYATLDNQPLKIEIKDGKISYAKGGPKYNIGKAMARDYKVLGTAALYSLGIFSTGGLALAIAVPGLVIAGGAAMALAAPGILIGETARGIVNRISNAVKKSAWHTNVDLKKLDKNQDINNQTKKEVEVGLKHIRTQTEQKLAEIENNATLSDDAKQEAKAELMQKLNLECGLLQQKIATMSGSTIEGSGFTITDGQGNVSSYNAYQCLMFQRAFNEKVDQRKEIDKSIKGLSARLAKGKELRRGQSKTLDKMIAKYFSGEVFANDADKVEALQNRSNAINTELEGMQHSFSSGTYQAPPDARHAELLDRSKNMQAYLIAKIQGVYLEDGIKVDDFMSSALDQATLQHHMDIIEGIKNDLGEFDLEDVLARTPANAEESTRREIERETGAGLGADTDLETEVKPTINLDDEQKKEDESSRTLQLEDDEDIKSIFMGLSPSFDAIKDKMNPIWDETLSEMNALNVTPETIDSAITYLNNQDNISEENSDVLARLQLVRFKYNDYISDSTKLVEAIEKQEGMITQLNENSNIDPTQIENAYSELVSVCEELAEKHGVEIKIDVPKIEILSTARQAEDTADAMRALTEPSDDNLSLVNAFKMMKSGAIDESFIDKYPHHIRDIGERCSRYKYFEKLKEKESINITINGEKITLTRDEAKQMQDNFAKINSVLKGEKEEKTDTELDIALIRTLIAKMNDLENIHKKFAGPDEELLGNEEDLATELRKFYDANHAILDQALSSESLSDSLKEDIKQAIEYYNHYGSYLPIGYQSENNVDPNTHQEIETDETNSNDTNNVISNKDNNNGNNVDTDKQQPTPVVTTEEILEEQRDDTSDINSDESNATNPNGNPTKVEHEDENIVDPNEIAENTTILEEEITEEDDSRSDNANEKISRISKIKAKLASILEGIKNKKEEHKAHKQEKKNSNKKDENLLDEESKLKLGEKILQLRSKLKNASISTGKAIKSAGLKTISAVKTAGITVGKGIKTAGIKTGNALKTAAGAVVGVVQGAISNAKGILHKNQITFASIVDELKSEDFDAEAFFNRHSDNTITEIKHVITNQVKPAISNRKRSITYYKNNQNSLLKPPSPIIEHGGVEFNVNEFDNIMNSIDELSKYELSLKDKKIKKNVREKLVYDKQEDILDWQHAVEDLASESFDPKNFLEKYEYRISKEAERVVLRMKTSFDRQRKQQIADENNKQKAAAGGYEYNSTFVWKSTLKYGDMSFDEDKVTKCIQSLEKIQKYQIELEAQKRQQRDAERSGNSNDVKPEANADANTTPETTVVFDPNKIFSGELGDIDLTKPVYDPKIREYMKSMGIDPDDPWESVSSNGDKIPNSIIGNGIEDSNFPIYSGFLDWINEDKANRGPLLALSKEELEKKGLDANKIEEIINFKQSIKELLEAKEKAQASAGKRSKKILDDLDNQNINTSINKNNPDDLGL